MYLSLVLLAAADPTFNEDVAPILFPRPDNPSDDQIATLGKWVAFGVSAHAHSIAKTFRMTATLPSGETKTMLSISDRDFA